MVTRMDVAVAAAVVAVAVLGAAIGGAAPADPAAYVFAVAQGLPLLWRRSGPVAVLVVTTAVVVAHGVLTGHPNVGAELGPYAAAYAVGAFAPGWRPAWLAGASAVAIGLVGGGIVVRTTEGEPFLVGTLVATAAVVAAVYLAGRVSRGRRDAAEERMRRAVVEERARIARELHDIVAHHVGVMVIQAGAGRRLAADDPDRAKEAFEQIERSGREALTAMPVLIGSLRTDDGGDLLPQPSLGDLDDLVERVGRIGLRVRIVREGAPRPLPSSVEVSAYRIVQEALTNAAKHAAPARVTVTLRYVADGLEIAVEDDGLGGGVAIGSGHGLAGMRERAALLGGQLEAGPRPEGGFEVRAHLPVATG